MKIVPKTTCENLVAAYLMIGLWQQFGSDLSGQHLTHNFMGAPEEAGEWLEDLGMVKDCGWHFELTRAGEILMDAPDYHSISDAVLTSVREAIA